MGLFGGNKSEKKEAPANAKPELAGRNKEARQRHPDNRDVLWGNSFRTSTFTAATGGPELVLGNFYLLAQKNRAGKWNLFRVTEIEDWVSREEISGGPYWFFDAIDYLAAFESTAAQQGYLPGAVDEKEKLGFSHYEAFGMREGLVFDVHTGLPHETIDGEIVTAGDFKKSDFVRVKEKHDEGKARLKEIFESAGQHDLIRSIMPETPDARANLAAALSVMKKREKLKEIIRNLDDALTFWSTALRKGFDYVVREEKKTRKVDRYDSWSGRHHSEVENYKEPVTASDSVLANLSAAGKMFLDEFKDVEEGVYIKNGLHAMITAFRVARIQAALYGTVGAGFAPEKAFEQVKEEIEEEKERLRTIGMPEMELLRFEAAIAEGFTAPPKEIPKAVLEFVDDLRRLQQEMLKTATITARPKFAPPQP